MKWYLTIPGTIARPEEIEQGMAGQRNDLYQRYLQELKETIRFADEHGFEGIGHNEHHLQIEGFEESNHPAVSSMFYGMNSKRLKIGQLGYVLPTHNPVRVAEEIATVDHMLGGRLYCGFVRGYQKRWTANYAAVPGATAITPQERKSEADELNRAIFEESLEIIKLAWASEVFSYEGKFWKFPVEGIVEPNPTYWKMGKGVREDGLVEKIGIAPRPLQQPHPPIYGAHTHSMRTVKFWARQGGKPIIPSLDLDFCEVIQNVYVESSGEQGREVAKEDAIGWSPWIVLGKTDEEAQNRRRGTDFWIEKWSQGFIPEPFGVLCGDPDTVGEQIEKFYERLKFNEIFVSIPQSMNPEDEVLEMLEMVSSKFMPYFEKVGQATTTS